MNSAQTQQARQFLAVVEAACADLAPAERSRLVGGLEEHLSELSADGVDLAAELGEPAVYARELRSAAGFATGPAAMVPAGAGAGVGTAPQLPVPRPAPSTAKVLLAVVAGLLGFGAILVTALAVLGFAFFTTGGDASVMATPVPAMVVPDLTGTPEVQARQTLAESGLSVVIDTAEAAASAGTVLSQDPAGGASVEPGSEVRITVSSGP